MPVVLGKTTQKETPAGIMLAENKKMVLGDFGGFRNG
jgi:hypothetical protein